MHHPCLLQSLSGVVCAVEKWVQLLRRKLQELKPVSIQPYTNWQLEDKWIRYDTIPASLSSLKA